MAKTVIGLFDRAEDAQKAVEELLKSGFKRRDVGVVSSELAREVSAGLAGASKGIAFGGLAGLLLAAAVAAIPGFGPVLVAGPAGVLLAGTTLGALAGGLIGGLTSRGVPEGEAHVYAEGVRRGGTLLTVNAATEELAQRAVEILKRHGAADIDERAAEWRSRGWSGRFTGQEPRQAPQPAQGEAPQQASQRPAKQEPVEAERVAAANEEEPVVIVEPEVTVEGVRVYSFVIEAPAEAPSSYSGPERRTGRQPYSGMERRQAA